jgi:hypothetical protein
VILVNAGARQFADNDDRRLVLCRDDEGLEAMARHRAGAGYFATPALTLITDFGAPDETAAAGADPGPEQVLGTSAIVAPRVLRFARGAAAAEAQNGALGCRAKR